MKCGTVNEFDVIEVRLSGGDSIEHYGNRIYNS